MEVIELCRETGSDRRDDERLKSADIAYQLGKYYEERDGNNDDALQCYNECLKRSNNENVQAMIAIARINQQNGNNDVCFNMCQKALKVDPGNEQATYMSANLLLMKNETDKAIKTYQDYLNNSPDNFNVLANLIELLRRAGKIDDSQQYIELAE